MEKVFVARRVASKLFATEASVDAALSHAAELMTEMLQSRKDVKLAATVGDDAAAKLVEAIKALGEARTAMVGVHNELNDVKLRLGIRTQMSDFEQKPPGLQQASQTTMRDVG